METERQSLGFFDQVIYSVKPSKYAELMNQAGRKVISYVIILSLCLSIMQYVIPVAGWFISFGGLDNLFTEVLPTIELNNGRLSVEDKIEIGADSSTYILIDTERVAMQVSDLDTDTYLSEILVAEENVLIYTTGMDVVEIRFADLGNISLKNADLKTLKPFIYMVIGFSFLAHTVSMAFDLVFWGALMSLCCWGPFRVKGAEGVKFTQIIALAIYAQTAAKLITAFNGCVNLIPDNFIVYYVGMLVSMCLLMSGLRKLEGKVNE